MGGKKKGRKGNKLNNTVAEYDKILNKIKQKDELIKDDLEKEMERRRIEAEKKREEEKKSKKLEKNIKRKERRKKARQRRKEETQKENSNDVIKEIEEKRKEFKGEIKRTAEIKPKTKVDWHYEMVNAGIHDREKITQALAKFEMKMKNEEEKYTEESEQSL